MVIIYLFNVREKFLFLFNVREKFLSLLASNRQAWGFLACIITEH